MVMRRTYDKSRMIGRVSQRDWDSIKNASRPEGMSFTKWATKVLLRAAKRQAKRNNGNGQDQND